MQISKKVPFDNPSVLNGVRTLYIVSNLIIAGIYFYVQQKINKKNGAFSAACIRHLTRASGAADLRHADTTHRYDRRQVRGARPDGFWRRAQVRRDHG